MHAIEFVTELSSSPVLSVPKEAAAQLPKSGKARVIVLTGDDAEDDEWRKASYEQFMREDAPEDSVYDKYR